MPLRPPPVLGLLTPLLLLAACGSTDHIAWESHTARQTHMVAQTLNQRMAMRLADDVAAHTAAVQPLLDGTQVTLIDTTPVPGGPATELPGEGSARASLVEAMLDPSLMRIELSDTSSLPDDQRAQRISDLADYFRRYGLGQTLVPPTQHVVLRSDAVPQPPPGLTVTIAVLCPPDRHDGSGYGSGAARPDCS
jgi:hypothetical protein